MWNENLAHKKKKKKKLAFSTTVWLGWVNVQYVVFFLLRFRNSSTHWFYAFAAMNATHTKNISLKSWVNDQIWCLIRSKTKIVGRKWNFLCQSIKQRVREYQEHILLEQIVKSDDRLLHFQASVFDGPMSPNRIGRHTFEGIWGEIFFIFEFHDSIFTHITQVDMTETAQNRREL